MHLISPMFRLDRILNYPLLPVPRVHWRPAHGVMPVRGEHAHLDWRRRRPARGRADLEGGFVKIHVKQGTDKIVGATIVARHAGEMISEIGLAMRAGIGMKTIADTIHPYPTQAEAIRKTAEAWNRTRLTPTVSGIFDRWMSWTR